MSYVALSGLSAAQLDLNTTSNNIANANTFGFKESRAEFGDVYSTSLFTNAKTTPGGGAQAQKVAQQFHEGSSIYTNNPLDLRIQGTGFFAVARELDLPDQNELTRNGAFHINKDSYIVSSNEEYLMGYDVNPHTGDVSSYQPGPIKVEATFGSPKQTSEVTVGVNLPASAEGKSLAAFDYSDPDSYNRATSSTIYDSQGKPYKLTAYYVKDAANQNEWHKFYTVGDSHGEKPVNIAGGDTSSNGHVGHTMRFNNDGSLAQINSNNDVTTETLGSAGVDLGGADDTQTLSFNLDDSTQYAAPFEVTKMEENGATTGFLTKIDLDENGSVLGTYSNGESVALGRVAMVRVPNEQGLDKKGGTQWDSTQSSGDKIWGESNKGSFGSINNGTLEQSNIDMTQELVDLISAQRNFQANSRSLEVHNQLQQNILQIR
ncbi:flagellar hook protein FlgE [Vibrio sp. FNV 38]|nr:flagellar hook protein FlgE [Vibrio sp. FNV 38]